MHFRFFLAYSSSFILGPRLRVWRWVLHLTETSFRIWNEKFKHNETAFKLYLHNFRLFLCFIVHYNTYNFCVFMVFYIKIFSNHFWKWLLTLKFCRVKNFPVHACMLINVKISYFFDSCKIENKVISHKYTYNNIIKTNNIKGWDKDYL